MLSRPFDHICMEKVRYKFLIIIIIIIIIITCLGFSCTLVFPYPRPRKVWWSVHAPFEGYVLAPKGAKGVVLTLTRVGLFPQRGLCFGICGCFSSLAVFFPSPSPQKRK